MAVPTVITDMSSTAGNNFPTGAETIGSSLDEYLRAYQAIIRAEYDKTVVATPPGGRLTLTSGTAVTTSDVTGASAATIYYTPHISDKIQIFDGTNWKQYTFTEKSIAVPATTATMYDLFIFDSSGTPTLEALAWTNDTTRATAIVLQNGVYVKSGATSRRYLGSFRTTGSSGQTEDSVLKRYVWNYYNRVQRNLSAGDGTGTWTYSLSAWRQANGNTANQVETVIGVIEEPVSLSVTGGGSNNTATARVIGVGVGVNSTTVNSAQVVGACGTVAGVNLNFRSEFRGFPTTIGRTFWTWLEQGNATGGDTQTWVGSTGIQVMGLVGTVFG